jgi:fumagillin biosynthesis dioxygenase
MMELPDILREVEANGFCVVPDILAGEALAEAQAMLQAAIERSRAAGLIVFDPRLDPNSHNIRLNNLPELDPYFVGLLQHPKALPIARALLGQGAIVSNFTGNIAYPGAGSMNVHSDQALVVPGPWAETWALNLIWCLDEVRADNGATLYLPGSHRARSREDLPDNLFEGLRPFEGPAGSIIVMDGRLWHTSGVNVTADERRALLFAFYCRGFLRQQVNWGELLSPERKAALDDEARDLLGIGVLSNIYGADLVMKSGYSVESVDVYHAQS